MNATPSGVTVPVSLFTAMASCYYGTGPRLHEARESPPLPPSSPDQRERGSEPLLNQEIADPETLEAISSHSRWTPLGCAAKARHPAAYPTVVPKEQ